MTITKIISHPIGIIVISIVCLLFFISLDRSAQKTSNSSENIALLEEEIADISQEIVDLQAEVLNANSPEFTQKVLRNELLLQKKGEYVLSIQEPSRPAVVGDCELNEDSGNGEGGVDGANGEIGGARGATGGGSGDAQDAILANCVGKNGEHMQSSKENGQKNTPLEAWKALVLRN